jgi:CheY-like chemotaxis protein
LSMVYGFAEQSGGTVSIESEVGAGTGVTIFLPAVMIQADSKPIRSDGAGIRVSKKSETVLVVEDQPDLLTVTAQMIGRMGYAVIEADNAQDALHKVSPLDGLDAAFLDVSLPGEINGIALAAALRERFPHIKILFTSGYVPEENRADLESIRHEGLFVKPVNIGELSARMGALFGGEEPKPEKIH